jgi:hypothetical protein
MKQRNQTRAPLIGDPELFLDIGADLARRTRQRLPDPRLKLVLLFEVQAAGAALWPKPASPSIPSSSYRRCQVRTVSSSMNKTFATAAQLMPLLRSSSAFARRQADALQTRPEQARSDRVWLQHQEIRRESFLDQNLCSPSAQGNFRMFTESGYSQEMKKMNNPRSIKRSCALTRGN